MTSWKTCLQGLIRSSNFGVGKLRQVKIQPEAPPWLASRGKIFKIGDNSEQLVANLSSKHWWEYKKIKGRAFSSSLLRAIIAHNHLLFFKIFSNFVYFCPNFQIFCPFLPFLEIFLLLFCPFSEKSHACPYFLE